MDLSFLLFPRTGSMVFDDTLDLAVAARLGLNPVLTTILTVRVVFGAMEPKRQRMLAFLRLPPVRRGKARRPRRDPL